MRLASIDTDNEMNYPIGVRIEKSKGELGSSNDIRSFLVIAQRT